MVVLGWGRGFEGGVGLRERSRATCGVCPLPLGKHLVFTKKRFRV